MRVILVKRLLGTISIMLITSALSVKCCRVLNSGLSRKSACSGQYRILWWL